MTLKIFAGFVILFVAVASIAQDATVGATTYSIRQIILDQNLIVAETSNPDEVL